MDEGHKGLKSYWKHVTDFRRNSMNENQESFCVAHPEMVVEKFVSFFLPQVLGSYSSFVDLVSNFGC